MAFGDFIQAATAVDTTGTSVTIGGAGFGSNVTAGNSLYVGGRVGAQGRTVTVTSDSTPATFTQTKNQTSGADHEGFLHEGLNQAGGVKPTVTFAISGAAATLRVVCGEWAGSSNTHLDKTASADGSGTTPASGATAERTDATELQLGVCSVDGTVTFTAGSGFTIRTQVAGKIALEDVVRTAVGTEEATFTIDDTGWECMTATFSDAASGVLFGPMFMGA